MMDLLVTGMIHRTEYDVKTKEPSPCLIVFAAAMMLSAGKGGYVTAAIAVLFVYIQLATLLLSGKYTHNRAVQ